MLCILKGQKKGSRKFQDWTQEIQIIDHLLLQQSSKNNRKKYSFKDFKISEVGKKIRSSRNFGRRELFR